MKLWAVSLLVVAACAPGQSVGRIDATKPSSLEVDLSAGDKIAFRVDAEGELGPDKADLTRREVIDLLRNSQLSVTVTGPNGVTSAQCPLKGNNGVSEGRSGAKLFTTGLMVACEVAVAQAGKHRISATMIWNPSLKPVSATVDVRRTVKK